MARVVDLLEGIEHCAACALPLWPRLPLCGARQALGLVHKSNKQKTRLRTQNECHQVSVGTGQLNHRPTATPSRSVIS